MCHHVLAAQSTQIMQIYFRFAADHHNVYMAMYHIAEDGTQHNSRSFQVHTNLATVSMLNADRLKCSNCNATGREDTFLLCDSCSHGYHAECVGQELPSTRFWWCPDCIKRGLTIKGLIIQVFAPG